MSNMHTRIDITSHLLESFDEGAARQYTSSARDTGEIMS